MVVPAGGWKGVLGVEAVDSSEALTALIRRHALAEPVYVTRPTMPPLDKYHALLERVWDSHWLTNNGQFHREFEHRLANYLGVEHINLFCNGTLALLVALQSLRIDGGEVITTPFTFPATPHTLYWNRVRPVFCDIDPDTLTLDPNRIEELVGPETKAILPVHVYGMPCDTDAIQDIADRHGLRVIYDAAHAFGVKYEGKSLADQGDLSMLSFHATKLFSTLEGGALVVPTDAQKTRIEFLKNFGIADQETVIGPGINGKMNELQAAYGLLQLDMIDEEIAQRGRLVRRYREELKDVPGLTLPGDLPGVRHNHAHFPILVDEGRFGMDRDALHAVLKRFNVFSRKYFHPLCSHYPCYAASPSSRPENLPVAERVARQVLCLPLYGTLAESDAAAIAAIVREVHALAERA